MQRQREGPLRMSQKERQRLVVLSQVREGKMRLSEAAGLLGLSYRQCQRLVGRLKEQGDAGLVHRSRGKPSSRRLSEAFRQSVLALYRKSYVDFGPTHAAETMLKRDGVQVHAETLRLWLIQAGVWQVRQRRERHHTWRPRKACFGEMVQLDGSVHDWFESRGPRCFLMVMVDDATGHTLCLFAEEETTWAAIDVLERWVRRFGVPASLYVDGKTVYLTDRAPTLQEELAGQEPLTRFGLACQKLGIRLVHAHSPQAKGRVERKNGVLQERLIKEMRLEGISDIAAANAFLTERFLPAFNAKFAVPARSPADAHQPVESVMPGLDLRSVFCLEEQRTLANDGTLRYHNQWLQVLNSRQQPRPKPGTKLTVQEWRDGSLHVLLGRWPDVKPLQARLLEGPPLRARAPKLALAAAAKPTSSHPKPAEDHYWRVAAKLPPELRQMRQDVQQLAQDYLPPVRVASATDTGTQQLAPCALPTVHPQDELHDPVARSIAWTI